MKKEKLFILAILLSFLPGCATFQPPSYSPDYETLDNLKKLNLAKLSVESFRPKDPKAAVNNISLRGGSMKAVEGAFSTYIENAIRSDMKEVGIFDPAANLKLDATVIKNDIDISGISKGSGTLAVKLLITKNGTTTLNKEYSTTTQFESSFAGAVAIGIGQREYPNLVRSFLKNVYNDPEFLNAIKK